MYIKHELNILHKVTIHPNFTGTVPNFDSLSPGKLRGLPGR